MALLDLQGMESPEMSHHGHPSSHSTHSCDGGGSSGSAHSCGGSGHGSGLSLLLCLNDGYFD